MKVVSKAAGVCAAVAAALVVSAAPAYAASEYVYEGSDYTEAVTDRRGAFTCDKEQDGNGVYGRVIGNDVRGYREWTLRDTNGSAAGCGDVRTDRPIVFIEVCEDDFGTDTCRGKWI